MALTMTVDGINLGVSVVSSILGFLATLLLIGINRNFKQFTFWSCYSMPLM